MWATVAGGSGRLKAQDQAANGTGDCSPDHRAPRRRQSRFKYEVDIKVKSRNVGLLKGHTVDISELGVSAILAIEVPEGEVVELEFATPYGPVKAYATVRQRNAFRYGFQFIEPEAVEHVIRVTCRQLAVQQEIGG